MAGYREVLRGWKQLGCAFDEALAAIDMATLLEPTEREMPEAAAFIQDARQALHSWMQSLSLPASNWQRQTAVAAPPSPEPQASSPSNSLERSADEALFGLHLPNFTFADTTPATMFDRVVEQAKAAETAGFGAVTVMDHLYQIGGSGN